MSLYTGSEQGYLHLNIIKIVISCVLCEQNTVVSTNSLIHIGWHVQCICGSMQLLMQLSVCLSVCPSKVMRKISEHNHHDHETLYNRTDRGEDNVITFGA